MVGVEQKQKNTHKKNSISHSPGAIQEFKEMMRVKQVRGFTAAGKGV